MASGELTHKGAHSLLSCTDDLHSVTPAPSVLDCCGHCGFWQSSRRLRIVFSSRMFLTAQRCTFQPRSGFPFYRRAPACIVEQLSWSKPWIWSGWKRDPPPCQCSVMLHGDKVVIWLTCQLFLPGPNLYYSTPFPNCIRKTLQVFFNVSSTRLTCDQELQGLHLGGEFVLGVCNHLLVLKNTWILSLKQLKRRCISGVA